MKKGLFVLMTACLLNGLQALAGNVLTVNDVNVPQGGQNTIEIGCSFDTEFTAFELQISLPEGLSLLTDEFGKPVIERAFNGSHVMSGNLLSSNGNYKFTCYSTDENDLSMPTNGALFRVTIQADANLSIGAELTGSITACEFTRTADSNGENLTDVGFTIRISEYRTILDETSTTAPADETNVNVRVRRNIAAGKWNTICLPFAMTAEQVTAAFGSDVQLANFTSWKSEEDGDGAIVGINVGFTSVTAIEANHPYIIKVSSPVSEFTVDGVDIEVSDDPKVQVGKKSSERGYMHGTYTATKVPEENVFLSGNKFWYSTGQSPILGYRAYFEFKDVLDSYYDVAEARISFTVDSETTDIKSTDDLQPSNGAVYSLDGRRLTGKPARKGIYVKDGKKLMVR